jgi:hypothetical protein
MHEVGLNYVRSQFKWKNLKQMIIAINVDSFVFMLLFDRTVPTAADIRSVAYGIAE